MVIPLAWRLAYALAAMYLRAAFDRVHRHHSAVPTSRGAPEATWARPVVVDVLVYGDDCRLSATLTLTQAALTDALNVLDSLDLRAILAESIVDGHQVIRDAVDVPRPSICAIAGTGATLAAGGPLQRARLKTLRVALEVGPYRIVGDVAAAPGTDPRAAFGRQGPMVPVTEAFIEWTVEGISVREHHAVLIVNRDLASWVEVSPGADVHFPSLPAAAPIPRVMTGDLPGVI